MIFMNYVSVIMDSFYSGYGYVGKPTAYSIVPTTEINSTNADCDVSDPEETFDMDESYAPGHIVDSNNMHLATSRPVAVNQDLLSVSFFQG